LLRLNWFTLPLEVLGHPGLEEYLDKFASVHDVFGNQIDVPVPVVAQVLVGLLFLSEELPQVGQVYRCALTTVKRISVNMENFLA